MATDCITVRIGDPTTLDHRLFEAIHAMEENNAAHLHLTSATPFHDDEGTGYLLVLLDEQPYCQMCAQVREDITDDPYWRYVYGEQALAPANVEEVLEAQRAKKRRQEDYRREDYQRQQQRKAAG